jgi:hypothetical protein
MKNLFEKKPFVQLLSVLSILLVAWIIFAAGMLIGYHKASFSKDRDEAYRTSLGSPNSPFAPLMRDADDADPHGAMGQIVSVDLPLIMIKGPSSAEQVVILSSSTMIRLLRGTASTSDLKSGEYAIAIGAPNSTGEIQASFVRIIPAPTGR